MTCVVCHQLKKAWLGYFRIQEKKVPCVYIIYLDICSFNVNLYSTIVNSIWLVFHLPQILYIFNSPPSLVRLAFSRLISMHVRPHMVLSSLFALWWSVAWWYRQRESTLANDSIIVPPPCWNWIKEHIIWLTLPKPENRDEYLMYVFVECRIWKNGHMSGP